jgi:chemotaxis protein CheZ
MSEHPMYQRLGELTRLLHDALQQLGYDKKIEDSLGALPDARTRLSFIAKVTGNAAEKVLNTVDRSQAQQEAMLADAERVEKLLKTDPVGAVARGEVLHFIGQVQSTARDTSAQLTEIMLAQDFHDLTGQTVGKVVDIAVRLEDALLQLLVDSQPAAAPTVEHGFLNGPVADAEKRTDVVANQAQVDDLLESLGF